MLHWRLKFEFSEINHCDPDSRACIQNEDWTKNAVICITENRYYQSSGANIHSILRKLINVWEYLCRVNLCWYFFETVKKLLCDNKHKTTEQIDCLVQHLYLSRSET